MHSRLHLGEMEAHLTEADRKTALVTGSTDGVGRVVAKRLSERGWRVLVHGRDRDRGHALVTEIEAAGGTAEFLPADLSSLVEVRGLANTVTEKTGRLDLLINNAGLGTGGPRAIRQTSADGYELRFAVNYLAGFVLTHLLLPLIKGSAPARIVNVSSVGQEAIDFDDVMLMHGYSGLRAYRQSKLAQILFTIDLARAHADSGITANALHPATYMDTAMVRQSGVTPISSVDQGAAAIIRLAVSPELDGRTGLFFNGQQEARAGAQAYDAEARQRLKALSFKLGGLSANEYAAL
jgi:NAD(P)-dependent dehydrogenase (short-subunit alcohol dehydrogenase family)